MPVKVRVMNCQSIRDAVIVIDGFTVITGPNNSGKTAFMRALRAPFINPSVSALVRHGADDMVVGIDFGEGKSVVFKKGKTKPTYVINGGKPLHPGGSVPDELFELGVYPLEVGGDKLWPQIATQFSDGKFSGPVFLLNKPGRIMAEVVSDVERVGRLSKAMKLCDSDRRAAVSKLKVRRKDKAKTEAELDKFLGLDSVIAAVDAIEAAIQEAGETRAEAEELAKLETRHQSRTQEVEGLKGIEDVPVPSSDAVQEAAQVGTDVQALVKLESRYEATSGAVAAIEGITAVEVPEAALITEAKTVGVELGELVKLEQRMADASNAVSNLAGIEAVNVPESGTVDTAREVGVELGELLVLEAKLTKAQGEADAKQAAKDAADSVQIDETLWEQADRVSQGLAVLDGLMSKHDKAQSAITTIEAELAKIDGELSEANGELIVVMGEIGTCPTCHTPMDETHLHGEVA